MRNSLNTCKNTLKSKEDNRTLMVITIVSTIHVAKFCIVSNDGLEVMLEISKYV